ncbi:HAD-IC family P-type ATPase [Levilactobacillus bambusae]|uniref:Divalent cation transporter n=1 Tax=Levilactobacillus bambusae TaxID=2024736 RepID=A0A2V1N0C6_9LACO|nr:HAD-IC family P-type ATPase [Levilactobacillus bambusae]PWG00699.1 divalent cation transporter [Levilactobacillus bambusae]
MDQNSLESTYQGTGLTTDEINQEQRQFGPNVIQRSQQTTLLQGIIARFWGPIPWLLEATLIFEVSLGNLFQTVVIFGLLLFSAVDGAIQEHRAQSAIGFLHTKETMTARVKRNGTWQTINVDDLVPGDIVHLFVGDLIPADGTLEAGSVVVDESELTGESAAIEKTEGATVSSGTVVKQGAALMQVVKIGAASTAGKTAALVKNAKAPGQLQQLLFTVVRYLAYMDLVLIIILVIVAVFRGIQIQVLLPFMVILIVATIPISMPSSFTVANSIEAKYLAQHQILVTDLTGIQDSATMTVLLTDKTGTLTTNRPVVQGVTSFQGLTDTQLLQLAAVACDPSGAGTIDRAIIGEAAQRGLTSLPRLSYTPFDPNKKVTVATTKWNDQPLTVTLGSPTVLLTRLSKTDQAVTDVIQAEQDGDRVLALTTSSNGQPATLQGLIALADEPRQDAATSIADLQERGVKVVMLTGDSSTTAKSIATKVGIGPNITDIHSGLAHPLEYNGFSDVYPQDKFELVKALQKAENVVGMTGDGINDAPALKQANVGIAVSNATDVAKEAAKVVLTEPRLSDISKLIDSGHRVYQRMLTWTITKLARTAELAVLLTFGYLLTDFFPVNLSMIVFIIVMNDLVTLTLGTDRTSAITHRPEKWRMGQIIKIASIFTIGWLIIGFGLLDVYLTGWHFSHAVISSLLFVFLIDSPMATIYMTRTRGHFWKLAPSRPVFWMTLINVIVASAMAIFGILLAKAPVTQVALVLGIVVVMTFVLDEVKVLYYRNQN